MLVDYCIKLFVFVVDEEAALMMMTVRKRKTMTRMLRLTQHHGLLMRNRASG